MVLAKKFGTTKVYHLVHAIKIGKDNFESIEDTEWFSTVWERFCL